MKTAALKLAYVQLLEDYTKKNKEKVIMAASTSADKIMTKMTEMRRKNNCMNVSSYKLTR